MRKSGALFVLTVSASLSAVIWNSMGLAAAEWIKEPNPQSLQGGHWYYHTDPVSQRKCWYTGRPGLTVPQVGRPSGASPM
jgi:hypothetical protein